MKSFINKEIIDNKIRFIKIKYLENKLKINNYK